MKWDVFSKVDLYYIITESMIFTGGIAGFFTCIPPVGYLNVLVFQVNRANPTQINKD